MPSDGICPSCGHLVIADLPDMPDVKPDASWASPGLRPSAPPPKSRPDAAKPGKPDEQATSPLGDGLLRARDYSAQLLGVAIYSLLLHPTLAYLVFLAHRRDSTTVLTFVCAYLPLAWLITRLLCTADPQTGGWRIKDPYLRAIFMKLNAMWFCL